MNEQIVQELHAALSDAGQSYYKLVLLVGGAHSFSANTMVALAGALDAEQTNVGLEMSRALLSLSPRQRRLRAADVFGEIVRNKKGPVFLVNLEVLFDRDLQQDPLRLLQSVSRNQFIVASWNGIVSSGRLLYAEPEHPEYRNYDSAGVQIVAMENL